MTVATTLNVVEVAFCGGTSTPAGNRLAGVLNALKACHDRIGHLLCQFDAVCCAVASSVFALCIHVKNGAGQAGGEARVMTLALLGITHHNYDIFLPNAGFCVARCCKGDWIACVRGNMPLKCDCHCCNAL